MTAMLQWLIYIYNYKYFKFVSFTWNCKYICSYDFLSLTYLSIVLQTKVTVEYSFSSVVSASALSTRVLRLDSSSNFSGALCSTDIFGTQTIKTRILVLWDYTLLIELLLMWDFSKHLLSLMIMKISRTRLSLWP